MRKKHGKTSVRVGGNISVRVEGKTSGRVGGNISVRVEGKTSGRVEKNFVQGRKTSVRVEKPQSG